MDSVEFLDAVRDRHGLTSDNQLADFLAVNRGRLSHYRNRRRTLDPVACHKVAAALELDVGYVLASVQAERAKRTEDRAAWRRLAELAKRSATAAVLAAALLAGAPEHAQAAPGAEPGNIHYTHKRRGRRRGARVLRALRRFRGSVTGFRAFFSRMRENGRMRARLRHVRGPALVLIPLILSGCAGMSRSELAWQSMHLIDVAQTVNGPASDPCYWEADTFTGALIGERPHREAVIAWGLALGIAHYYAGAWLDRAELPEPIKIAARSIDLSYKGFTIGRNHAIGIRPFGDNAAGCPQPVPPRFDPGAQPWR